MATTHGKTLQSKTKTSRTKKNDSLAMADSDSSPNEHAGNLGKLRVLVTEESGTWFAHGLEIDYAAQGSSFEDVKRNFEIGLMLTMDSYLKIYGDLQRLLVVAPDEIWKEATAKNVSRYVRSSSHPLAAEWPFDGCDFYIRKAA